MPESIPSPRSGSREQRPPAVDTCWGVPVLAALCALLVALPTTFMAVLFSFIVEDYGLSREDASWPINVFTMVMQLSGLLISLLQWRISIASIIVLSCFISSIGITASAFASDVISLTITFGVLYGAGMGMFVTSSIVFNLRLFDKYKGTAVGFTFVAWAASGMYGPTVFTCLYATYGFNGALLLTGGLLLHSVPLSMLLKNPAFITPRCLNTLKSKLSAMVFRQSLASAAQEKSISPDKSLEASPFFQDEALSREALKTSNQIFHTVQEELPSADVNRVSTEGPLQDPKEANNITRGLQEEQTRKVSIARISVFKAPAFYVCMFATVVGEYSLISFGTTIVDFAVGKGIPVKLAMNLVTCTCVGQLLGRLVIVPLSDLSPACRWPLYAGSYVFEAFCTFVIPHVGSVWGIFVLRIAEAASQGFSSSIRGILLAQLLGVEAMAFCSGVFGLVMVPMWLTNPHIIGYFRDGMGSYDEFYLMLGAVNSAAAAVTSVFFALNWKRLQPKRRCDLVTADKDANANSA